MGYTIGATRGTGTSHLPGTLPFLNEPMLLNLNFLYSVLWVTAFLFDLFTSRNCIESF